MMYDEVVTERQRGRDRDEVDAVSSDVAGVSGVRLLLLGQHMN